MSFSDYDTFSADYGLDDDSSLLFGDADPIFDPWEDPIPDTTLSRLFNPPPSATPAAPDPAPPTAVADPAQHSAPARRNKVRNGEGAGSKLKMPDPFDKYNFKTKSIAYERMVGLGYPNVSLISVFAVCKAIMLANGITLTERNGPQSEGSRAPSTGSTQTGQGMDRTSSTTQSSRLSECRWDRGSSNTAQCQPF
jgi:hypothetical protein